MHTHNTEGRASVMFELTLVQIIQEERERRIAAGLHRRRILSPPHDSSDAPEARFVPRSIPPATGARVRIAER